MSKLVFKSQHTLPLIDVILGVIIAIPLLEIPTDILSLAKDFSLEGITTIFLRISSLVFCFFYWLGMHQFIITQNSFDEAVCETENNEITLMQIFNLFGGILMIATVAAIFEYAKFDTIIPFLLANMLFWFLDFMGSFFIKNQYRKCSKTISSIEKNNPEEYQWYIRRIKSPVPYVYAAVSFMFFFAALLIYTLLLHQNDLFRVIFGICLFFATFARHTTTRRFLL